MPERNSLRQQDKDSIAHFPNQEFGRARRSPNALPPAELASPGAVAAPTSTFGLISINLTMPGPVVNACLVLIPPSILPQSIARTRRHPGFPPEVALNLRLPT